MTYKSLLVTKVSQKEDEVIHTETVRDNVKNEVRTIRSRGLKQTKKQY